MPWTSTGPVSTSIHSCVCLSVLRLLFLIGTTEITILYRPICFAITKLSCCYFTIQRITRHAIILCDPICRRRRMRWRWWRGNFIGHRYYPHGICSVVDHEWNFKLDCCSTLSTTSRQGAVVLCYYPIFKCVITTQRKVLAALIYALVRTRCRVCVLSILVWLKVEVQAAFHCYCTLHAGPWWNLEA